MTDITRAPANALRRQHDAQHVIADLEALRADPIAWAGYLAEADATSVTDGID